MVMNPPQSPNQKNEFSVSFNRKADAALDRIKAAQNLDTLGALKRAMQVLEALSHDDAKGNLLRAEKGGLFLDTWGQKTILEIFEAESELGSDKKTVRSMHIKLPPHTMTRLNNITVYTGITDGPEAMARAIVFLGRMHELKDKGWRVFIEYPGSGSAPALEIV